MWYESSFRIVIININSRYHNIILSGGSTLFTGMSERLSKELLSLAPKVMKVKIIAADERKFSTWIGGSILASLESFQNKWITKSEYDENGAAIIHKKFPWKKSKYFNLNYDSFLY